MKALFLLLLTAFHLNAAEPSRADGLSVHMLPERVAKIKGEPGGFTVNGKTYEGAKELFAVFQRLPAKVQANGMWIVTTHPSSYSEAEQEKLKALIALCADKSVPIFTCRGSELPNGWKKAQ